jgi:uncharacterized protein (TIGR04141 family)
MASLNIFQIKSGITDPDEIIVDREKLWSHPIRIDGRLFGMVFVQRSMPKPPRWLPYFEGFVDFTGTRVQTSSTAAVLLVRRKQRFYTVTFGHGRWLLYEGVVEPRFGLKATLNAIEPTLIRSIDHKRLEGVSRHTREQLSKASGLQNFGLDVERDLLRAVTGTPSDKTLGTIMAGADQLAVVGEIPIRQLGTALDRYEALAEERKYEQNFGWVDNIAEVTDAVLHDALDSILVARLKKSKVERIWLAPPDVLDWTDFDGFRYRSASTAPKFNDLDLQDYFADVRAQGDLTIERLRADRVRCIRAVDGDERESWSVYRCIVAEVQRAGGTYALSESRWYRVDRDFLAGIDSAIAGLSSTRAQLPRFNDDSEQDYNKRAADSSGGRFVLLDQELIQSVSRGRVEVCDLYSRDRQFVHVKRYSSSSVLSHLFSQGVVSAQLFLSDRSFRQELNERLPDALRLADPASAITPSEFEVAYAIVARPKRDLELPFFSKVNLKNAAQLLQQLGYRVTVTAIPST